MKNDFILGTNYWASHAGTDMWRDWKEEVVREDLDILCAHGVECLRVFPNWRDFQPVEAMYGYGGNIVEYRMTGDGKPQNPYFLDLCMLEHFHDFCRIAAERGIRLIVGLLTGWMSGRLYIPNALFGKNLYTDPTAQVLEQLFIRGFVKEMKNEPVIYAWDLGNECNCMSKAGTRAEALAWTAMISNSIRACDPDRQIVSGMHSLEIEDTWNIQDQAQWTDILTTHPYPYFVPHCMVDGAESFRTLLHATAQSQYYATVGHKPCLVEEIGTLGPMICSNKIAGDFMRVNLFSNLANGASGLMWWCANEQLALTAPPYAWKMEENELGMLDKHRRPKPMLLEMKKFSELVKNWDFELPYRKTDVTCILTEGQDHWGIAYMSYILAKQAGLTMDFIYGGDELPESKVYFMPSVRTSPLRKDSYHELKRRIADGATLYLSQNDTFLSEFEELTGLQVQYVNCSGAAGSFPLPQQCRESGRSLTFNSSRATIVRSVDAEVLASDEEGNPVIAHFHYGKGEVYYVNFPLEEMLLNRKDAFSEPYYQLYQLPAAEVLKEKAVISECPYIGVTEHEDGDGRYVMLINYSAKEVETQMQINKDYEIASVVYGDLEKIAPCDALLLKLKRR